MMDLFKKIMHVTVPPANIIVSSLLATLNFTLKDDDGTEKYTHLIAIIACLQVLLTILNQIYSKLMKAEESKIKNELVEKESIIRELSVRGSISNHSSVAISSLTTSEAGEIKTPQEENNGHTYEYKTPY